MKIAFLLSCCFLSVAAHQLKYISTLVKPGQTFAAVVELDGQQILHWDNNTMTMVPDTEWMKKVSILEKNHWNKETEFMKQEKNDLDFLLGKIMECFQHQGNHSLSQIHGCYTNDENKKGFKWYNYDQKKFLSLDLNNIAWIPADDEAREYLNKKNWDSTKTEANAWKKVLETNCTKSLQLYVKYSMPQDPPKAEGFEPQLSSPDSESQNRRYDNGGVFSVLIVGSVVGFLVLVVGGMVFWRKKKLNSGFKPASSGSDAELGGGSD